MEPKPVICPSCGGSGAERPGFKRVPLPEAVGTVDGMMLVDSFECNNCGHLLVVPVGTIEVRREE